MANEKINGVDLVPVRYASADGLAHLYQTDEGKWRCSGHGHTERHAGDTLDEALASLKALHLDMQAVHAAEEQAALESRQRAEKRAARNG